MPSTKALPVLTKSICSVCRRKSQLLLSRRTFTTSTSRHASNATVAPLSERANTAPRQTPVADANANQRSLDEILSAAAARNPSSIYYTAASENSNDPNFSSLPHKLHIYATKHNTHLTLVQPPKLASQTLSSSTSSGRTAGAKNKKVDVLLSLSTGNLGFRKGNRSSYDAAFQLSAFFMKQMQEKGMLRDIRALEVILRGNGAGREAAQKVLLGTEGRFVRGRITAVSDATRIKFGGERSPKPRRLG